MESLIEVKTSMNEIMSKPRNEFAGALTNLRDHVLRNISFEAGPDQLQKRNPAIRQAWDQDPIHVLTQYGREASAFNKLIHTQEVYLGVMKHLNTANTDFVKGMKEFISEEYIIFTDGLGERAPWVDDMVYVFNAYQTARTMGFNVTGGIKNAASALHYATSVGHSVLKDAKESYRNDPKITDFVDAIEAESGFLFTDPTSELYSEGLISRDRFKAEGIEFDPNTGMIKYEGSPIKDQIADAADWTIGKLLVFHRLTENAQRQWMHRVALISKYKQLKSGGSKESEARTFAKNYALQTVNSWAYEYAKHAKAKPVRGRYKVVDEIGEDYIVAKQNGGGIAGGLSEIAFHLMHYPLSLAETHQSQMKGAWRAALAKQWDADELNYMKNYSFAFAGIQLASIVTNLNFNNILENESIERVQRVHNDLMNFDEEGKNTYGLMSEMTGPTLGQIKYGMIASGFIDLDESTYNKIIFGNVDYSDSKDQAAQLYEAYQYSTEYGRLMNKTWPAIRDGRGWDLARSWLKLYPSGFTKYGHEKIFGPKKGTVKKPLQDEDEQLRRQALNILAHRF